MTEHRDAHDRIADAIFRLAEVAQEHLAPALDGIARAIGRLGNGDASTSMGALEALGLTLKEGFERLDGGYGGTRLDLEGIESELGKVADAISKLDLGGDRG